MQLSPVGGVRSRVAGAAPHRTRTDGGDRANDTRTRRLWRINEALATVDRALTRVGETQERWHEAELWRIKGELLPPRADRAGPEGEACFRRAIEVAREQSARSPELRATVNLARLWSEQGERRKASDLLAPIYGWFTEGFDTDDLKDAKALLDELG